MKESQDDSFAHKLSLPCGLFEDRPLADDAKSSTFESFL
jgi:hypothetical protein